MHRDWFSVSGTNFDSSKLIFILRNQFSSSETNFHSPKLIYILQTWFLSCKTDFYSSNLIFVLQNWFLFFETDFLEQTLQILFWNVWSQILKDPRMKGSYGYSTDCLYVAKLGTFCRPQAVQPTQPLCRLSRRICLLTSMSGHKNTRLQRGKRHILFFVL